MATEFLCTITFYFILVSAFFTTIINGFSNKLPLPMVTNLCQGENLTHLHFYFQDIVSGKTPSAVQIAAPNAPYDTGFGVTMMADDTLTIEQDPQSEVIGHAQGIYAVASQNKELALLMVMNYVFTKGEYNGSSIALLGRNPVLKDVREMPIVGGTGLFRLARGYALAHTVWANPQGDATVEYNVYVYHMNNLTWQGPSLDSRNLG